MAFSKSDMFDATPFWHNGPTPGKMYNFPGVDLQQNFDGVQRSQTPIVTGTSVLGMIFKDGIILAADTLGSYGSLARYRNCERLIKVNKNIILGAGGDYADFQSVKVNIEKKIREEDCLDDGFNLKPKSLHCWITRLMYNKRSNLDPFWNNFIIAGFENGEPFLGTVDKLGLAYSDSIIATGYGSYLAIPLMKKHKSEIQEMNKEQAKSFIHKLMEILFYRDARSFPKYQWGIITKDGIEISDPIHVESNWEVTHTTQSGL